MPLSVAEVEFDFVAGPGGDATAEEVLVFSPDGGVEEQSGGDDGPVVGIAGRDSSAGAVFEFLVEGVVDDLNKIASDPIQNSFAQGRIETPLVCASSRS